MYRRVGIPLAVGLALCLVASADASAGAPSPVSRLAEQAAERARAHRDLAARLAEELDGRRKGIAVLERELARLRGSQIPLRESLAAARKATQASSRAVRAAAAARARAAGTQLRSLRAAALARHRRSLSAFASARFAALAAAAGAALLRERSRFQAEEELWRHLLRRSAWLEEALRGLPPRIAELEHRLRRQQDALLALVRVRGEALRRAGHAALLARGFGGLARMASLAAARSWSAPARAEVADRPTVVTVRELMRARPALLSAVARGPVPASAVAAPFRLGGPVSAAAPPRFVGTPVGGLLLTAYGDRAAGPLRRGVTLAVHAPRLVRAPRAGRVVFAAPFADFGPVLILDHGDGYHTLIAGMTRIDVAIGAVVAAGAPVGRLVASAEAPRRLYIELRRRGEPVDPLPWLVAGNNGEAGSG